MAVALVGVVIPKRVMLNAAVVPKCNRVRLPVEAHAELGRFDVPIEHLKDRVTLVLLKADNARREEAVDEKAFLAGHWMGPNDRMLGARIRLAAIIIAISSAKVLLTIVDRGKARPSTCGLAPTAFRKPDTCWQT